MQPPDPTWRNNPEPTETNMPTCNAPRASTKTSWTPGTRHGEQTAGLRVHVDGLQALARSTLNNQPNPKTMMTTTWLKAKQYAMNNGATIA